MIIYAAITVFVFPDSFKKDDKAVPSYAFPFYIIGTVFLFVGMLYCAIIIERSSKEYCLKPTTPSKLYWLQPGNQHVGDQVFNAFMAVKEGPGSSMTTKLRYIKSTRVRKYDGRYIEVYSTLFFTLLGFIIQFIGLRGAHASVILAQLGATFVMSVLRTCLRTQRMAPEENKLKEERDLTSYKQQELDSFAFHLENVKFFTVAAPSDFRRPSQDSEICAGPSARDLIAKRIRLAEITSGAAKESGTAWDHIPIRRVAQNLACTLQETMELVSSWGADLGGCFQFELNVECEWENFTAADTSRESYSIQSFRGGDTLQWKVEVNELEAVLGLWAWSLCKSNPEWRHPQINRLVGLGKNEASKEQTDACFYKWIFRQTEAKMASSRTSDSFSRLFGFDCDKTPHDLLVVETQNTLETMVAQDIYIHFLGKVLTFLGEFSGEVDVVPGSQHSFLAQSDSLDDLVSCFEEHGLGSREDALLCIVPNLKRRGFLPTLAVDSPRVMKRIEDYIKRNQWGNALHLARWICERSVDSEYQSSMYQFGNLCRRAIMDGDYDGQIEGLKQIRDLLTMDIRAKFFGSRRSRRPTGWMASRAFTDWWHNFSVQLGWILWHVTLNVPNARWIQSDLESLGVVKDLDSRGVYHDAADSAKARRALQQWLTYTTLDLEFERDVPGYEDQLAYNWASKSGNDAILYLFLAKWAELSVDMPALAHNAYVFAARSHSDWAIQTLHRHKADIESKDASGHSVIVALIMAHDREAVRLLLKNGAAVNGRSSGHAMRPVDVAAHEGFNDIVELLLQNGAVIERSSRETTSALYWACNNNKPDTVSLLLSHGADLDPIGPRGTTPLMCAVANEHVQMVEFLLQKGAKINARDNEDCTALMLAVKYTSMDILEKLIASGADTELRDINDMTALEIAIHFDFPQAVPLLQQGRTWRRSLLS